MTLSSSVYSRAITICTCLKRPRGCFPPLFPSSMGISPPKVSPKWFDLSICFHTPHPSTHRLQSTRAESLVRPVFICFAQNLVTVVHSCMAGALVSWSVHPPLHHGPQLTTFISLLPSWLLEGHWVSDPWLQENFHTFFPGLLRAPLEYLRTQH